MALTGPDGTEPEWTEPVWTQADAEALQRADGELREVFGDGRRPLEVMRQNLDDMMIGQGLPTDVTVTEVSAGGVPALRVSAGVVDDSAAVVWLHGGGYVMGSAYGYRGVAAAISAASGHPVVVPDYRRAPEAPFPAAVEDAEAVMGWAAQNFGDRWVLAGDSAGGGLTMASLIRARENGGPLPAGAVLMSPLADFTASGDSFDTQAGTDTAISRRSVKSLAVAYLQGHDPRDPLASPVFGDLAGLPATLILVSEREVLLDDAKMLHDALRRGGSPSTLSVYSWVCHAWTMFTAYMPRAQRAAAEIGDFVRGVLR
ncbi:alpha/beta hydrolase [Mycolicibacterium diernhoferi]|uniref:Alpha/beta hydrolase n=1 Tax=Mycolicibacterium diernhoferi TaxID=1801 RepID=A0A1Q4HCC5_9MYCO|nr:alpha/beta hydrolase [Mycolicibacterium diernhoferi]OJZ65092.1 alpha/beta hydrolase [Mycolicibacterium diernhoferi]OPE52388.1 alpha/beta hydrolase [Mycolicibacterium diernhoferi]PEG55020.1 alpha/beta hydrolase [Mycolicibacterium diernhoferi]QYL23697.1 alpha/beta hydrolase [Mycolicibacterium diernhoferi]